MRTNIIITIYTPASDPGNPLVHVPVVTTDDNRAKASFQKIAARELTEWRKDAQVDRCHSGSDRVTLVNDAGDTLVIIHHFSTKPIELTVGTFDW